MPIHGDAKEASIALVYPCNIIGLGLVALFEKHGYGNICWCLSYEALVKELHGLKPKIVLINHSECASHEKIKEITDQVDAPIAIIASSGLCKSGNPFIIMDKLSHGITGFLDLDEPIDGFLNELNDVIAGDIVISAKFKPDLLNKEINKENDMKSMLSDKEILILEHVANGSTNKEIGQELFISENTVKAYLTHILNKLDLKNRQQAVAYILKKRMSREPWY